MVTLGDRFHGEIQTINTYLENLIVTNKEVEGLKQISESMKYSLNNPGKRFRALLCMLTARTLGYETNLVLPYGAAVELVHTYSLVHDDLPAMDNDDYRRGQLSNHKVYGEAMAIIAGDALQTLAFELVADSYAQMSKPALKAVKVLALSSGYKGMVGGQAMDMLLGAKKKVEANDLKLLHKLKTGALICAATEGSAILCDGNASQVAKFSQFGTSLGLAFQLADDILDHRDDKPEATGFPKSIGLQKTKALLEESTTKAIEALADFGKAADDLIFISQFNLERTKQK